jgi:hypothetical protein
VNDDEDLIHEAAARLDPKPHHWVYFVLRTTEHPDLGVYCEDCGVRKYKPGPDGRDTGLYSKEGLSEWCSGMKRLSTT